MLEHFAACYLHQDWDYDYASSIDALVQFCKRETSENVAQLHEELIKLEGTPDANDEMFWRVNGNFKPSGEGMTAEQWIFKAKEILEGSI